MGWLRPKQASGPSDSADSTSSNADEEASSLNTAFTNLSTADEPTSAQTKYPIEPLDKPDTEIRFIPKSEVISHCPAPVTCDTDLPPGMPLWVIVDNIIYDCTAFMHEHPGGPVVLESFRGQDCSWQFWRFHGKEHLESHGKPLRVGRTSGFTNRHAEQERYVGLRKLGVDEDVLW